MRSEGNFPENIGAAKLLAISDVVKGSELRSGEGSLLEPATLSPLPGLLALRSVPTADAVGYRLSATPWLASRFTSKG